MALSITGKLVDTSQRITCDDIDAVHDGALDRERTVTSCELCVVVQMLSDTSTTRSIKADSMDLLSSEEQNMRKIVEHTSSKNVSAPYCSARSQISLMGPILPHIE